MRREAEVKVTQEANQEHRWPPGRRTGGTRILPHHLRKEPALPTPQLWPDETDSRPLASRTVR